MEGMGSSICVLPQDYYPHKLFFFLSMEEMDAVRAEGDVYSCWVGWGGMGGSGLSVIHPMLLLFWCFVNSSVIYWTLSTVAKKRKQWFVHMLSDVKSQQLFLSFFSFFLGGGGRDFYQVCTVKKINF